MFESTEENDRNDSNGIVCGVCNNYLKSEELFCVKCKCFYHVSCQDLNFIEYGLISTSRQPYICLKCTGDNGNYDFESALYRLNNSYLNGIESLKKSAFMEELFLRQIPRPEGDYARAPSLLEMERGSTTKQLQPDYNAIEILGKVNPLGRKKN